VRPDRANPYAARVSAEDPTAADPDAAGRHAPETNAITAGSLRAPFERHGPMTVGLEEELMLLDPATLDLAAAARDALAAVADDPRFKLELPASQIEILSAPCATVGEAAAQLAAGRRALVDALGGRLRVAGAGAHPFASGRGVLNEGPRYDAIRAEYGEVARRQLVCGLHVHVAVGGADRTLAVYNAMRSHLPELAALAANAPFYEGRDTGLASVRPKICDLLPRQGIPPAIASWEALASELRWGAAAGPVPEPRRWWWELRMHPAFGTVEVRVPDTQTTVADAAAVGALVHALAHRLAARYDAGEPLPAAPSWRIAENRWSACRHGLAAPLADLETGERLSARERLARHLDELAPHARELGCADELAGGRALLEANGSERQRAVAAERGVEGVAGRLADDFLA
jgi:carboxylate-amine ligase